MRYSKSGQTLTEVLTTAVILGLLVLLSANSYSNYTKGDARIRDSIVKAAFNDNFSQLSSDPYLVQEMFLGLGKNPSLQDCLERGLVCPKDWTVLEVDPKADWAYANDKLSFQYRSIVDEIVEIRMTQAGTRPHVVWISRYDYMNLDAGLAQLACPKKQVIAGIDYMSNRAICLIPTPGTAEKVPVDELE